MKPQTQRPRSIKSTLSNILRLRPYLQALISMIITLQVFADDFFSNMTFCQPLVYHPW